MAAQIDRDHAMALREIFLNFPPTGGFGFDRDVEVRVSGALMPDHPDRLDSDF